MTDHRDLVVAEALRDLDVPDHGPGFWAAVDAGLAGDVGPERDLTDDGADRHADADVIELPTDRRSTSARTMRSKRLPAVAAAAAVAAALALGIGLPAVQQAADGDRQVDVTDDPDGPSVPGTVDTTMPDATATAPEAPTMTAEQAEANAVEWLDRLFAGDIEGAYGLLDDTSRAAMGFEDFQLLGAGLFEGAAAFAGDGITRDIQQFGSGDEVVSVVTFSGQVEREGMVETDSYPVVLTVTGVHFTLDGPQLELDPAYADSSGTTLTSPMAVLVGESTDAWVWFDGGDAQPLAERGVVSIDVEAAAGPGTHLVNLLAVQGDRLVARAHTVVVP